MYCTVRARSITHWNRFTIKKGVFRLCAKLAPRCTGCGNQPWPEFRRHCHRNWSFSCLHCRRRAIYSRQDISTVPCVHVGCEQESKFDDMSVDMVTNPTIPYSGPIPGGLFPSKIIHVQGFVPHGSQRFSVNLQCGVAIKGPDIAFRFNPRFQGGQHLIVCNTLTGGRWGSEERHQPSPFAHGQNFHVIIRCEQNSFKVTVNGRHFAEYHYRIQNLQRINSVMVDGTVNIYSIRFEPSSAAPPAFMAPRPAYPAAQPTYPPDQPTYPAGPKVVTYPALPYLESIPGGMKQGKIIVVKVTVKPNPTRFHVNFQCGLSTNPRSDVAFHFNPRFNQKAIVMNTLRNTRWDGNEERRRTQFPFRPNGTYEMMFLCDQHEFKVALNGSHLLAYKHRLPFQNISALQTDGDCVVTEVNYH